MKFFILTIMTILTADILYAQTKEEKEILTEGSTLYKTEMASWYGTDIFLDKYANKQSNAGGYFSYLSGNKSVCVFFSRGDSPKIIGTFTFDSTYNVNTAVIDGQERELTEQESDLWTIRRAALSEYQKDTLFKSYQGMNPNFIPLNDDKGKRVYILTGPQQQGVVVFGNDYLITFNKKNKLQEKKRLHKNIISIEYGKQDGKLVLTTMHTHLPETGDLILATDICTLMLYEKYAGWAQHNVLSAKNVSIWDCRKNKLTVITKEAWDRINEHQNQKNKK